MDQQAIRSQVFFTKPEVRLMLHAEEIYHHRDLCL